LQRACTYVINRLIFEGGNALTGTIPTEILQLDSLQVLDLGEGNRCSFLVYNELLLVYFLSCSPGGNNLTGEIPTEIALMEGMRVLDLGVYDVYILKF